MLRSRASSLFLPPVLLVLLCCSLPWQVSARKPHPDSVAAVAFTRYKNAPNTWTKHDSHNVTISDGIGYSKNPFKAEMRFSFRATTFEIALSVPTTGAHTLRAACYDKEDCKVGRRRTQLGVNGALSEVFDISTEVGCGRFLLVDVPFVVEADGLVTFRLARCCVGLKPRISYFEIFPGDAPPKPSPTPFAVSPTPSASPVVAAVSVSPTSSPLESVTPSSSSDPLPSDIIIDVGESYPIEGTIPVDSTSLSIDTSSVSNVPSSAFSTARAGTSFAVALNLPPGTYTVILGFVEVDPAFCSPSTRVFNVLINGFVRLESYDIYSAAGQTCRKAVSERFVNQIIDPLNPVPFSVSFHAISGDAVVSYIRIRATDTSDCESVDGINIAEDHLAHAVPGVYPPNDEPAYVDTSGAGFVNVNIDGSGSHTHFDTSTVSGRITSYTWVYPETGQVVSTDPSFSLNVPLGTTRLRLTVIDNACSVSEAETSITVTGNIINGMWCYYYEGLSDLNIGSDLSSPRASFAAKANSVNLGFPGFDFKNSNFVARCQFFLEFDTVTDNTVISVDTSVGFAHVYKGEELVLDTLTNSSTETSTSIGYAAYELRYMRSQLSGTPSVTLRVNGSIPSTVVHDRSTIMPIITEVDPDNGPQSGGFQTTIAGYGLFRPLTAHFGSGSVAVQNSGSTSQLVIVFPPSAADAGAAGVVPLTVESPAGLVSNQLTYSYGSTCDPIGFSQHNMTHPGGANLEIFQPTSVVLWQDGKLYIGTRPGTVEVVSYNHVTLETTSICHSEEIMDSRYDNKFGDPAERAILGLTFDPRDTTPRPYLALSTMFWQRQGKIELNNTRAWSNGAVVRLKPASAATVAADPDQCLEYDQMIVDYIPVSDGDHSVNEMVFTQDGDLLIAVGGNTNAGLPYKLGGNFGTFLSGAVIIAHLSRPGFDGTIQWTTPDNLRTAMPQSTDVELYATGLRNMFSMTMARNGRVYGGDMGPNCGFGNVSSACSEYNEAEAALRGAVESEPMDGVVFGGEDDCLYSAGRKDKLVEIKSGKFYGHSNLVRGTRLSEEGECVWIDPDTGLSPPPFFASPPSNYEHRIAMVKSASTGVLEYGSNVFCGELRGDIIMSTFKARKAWRLQLDPSDGSLDSGPTSLFSSSGLRIVENQWGDLIFPNYKELLAIVHRPIIAGRGLGLFAANALPFRHGRAGGTLVRIGGWGFVSGTTSVSIGGRNCAVTSVAAEEVVCQVPAYAGGAERQDLVVTVGGVPSSLPGAILYMSV